MSPASPTPTCPPPSASALSHPDPTPPSPRAPEDPLFDFLNLPIQAPVSPLTQTRPLPPLPPGVTHCGDALFFLLPDGVTPQCPVCSDTLANRNTLSRHFLRKHALQVSVAKEPPRKTENTPTFAKNADARFQCPNCSNSFVSTTSAKEHWQARYSFCHSTPQFGLGFHFLIGNLAIPASSAPPLPVPPLAPLAVLPTLTPPTAPKPAEHAPGPPQNTPMPSPPSSRPPPQPPPPQPIRIYGDCIAKVPKFKYLGRILAEDDDDSPAIADRIAQASHTFWSLHRRFLAKKHVSSRTKLTIANTVLMTKIVYGAESWVITEHDADKLRACQQKLLRHALGMHPRMTPDGLRYPPRSAVLAAAGQSDIIDFISSCQLRAVGHMLRRPASDPSHDIWQSTIPAAGRVGFVDANLLSSRTWAIMASQSVSPADAPNRKKWHDAVVRVRKRPQTTHTLPTHTPTSAPATASAPLPALSRQGSKDPTG